MATESSEKHDSANSPPKENNTKQELIENSDERNKLSRHPRWTRQETFILIQSKKDVEKRVTSRGSTSAFGSVQHQRKWDSVSSYCKQHGVDRGPVQCRKRWSNLLSDFRKIKTWESRLKENGQSFWMMRSDFRRERKLPGFYDREIYELLNGKVFTAAAYPLAQITPTDAKIANGVEAELVDPEQEDEEEEEAEGVCDRCQNATGGKIISSDSEQPGQGESGWSTEKEADVQDSPTKTATTALPLSDPVKEKHPDSNIWKESKTQEGRKRRRLSINEGEDTSNLGDQLLRVLERNNNMLNAQLEAQNINCQLDRDQRKKDADSLVAALSKLTDALVGIANKL